MTTSRDPKQPRDDGKSAPAEGASSRFKRPFSRRIKYLVEDSGYALKKAGRRITDPIKDAGAKRGPAAPNAPKPGAGAPSPQGRSKPASPATDGATRRRRAPKRPDRRRRSQPSPSGARRLGERPVPADSKGRGRPRPKAPSASGVAAAITGFGERSSILIRRALSPLGGPISAVGAISRKALAGLAAFLTPLRAVVAVTALAAILLGVAQFTDYRGVAVGVADYAAYSDVEAVAPAPQVDRQPAGSAHSYLLLPLAAIALVALVFATRGRWQLGRVVSLLGLVAIAVTLLVDMPAGLDEGEQAIAYAGVEAQLVEGFYAQLCAAAVMVVGGLLVSRYARSTERRSPRPKRRAARVAAANARPA